MILCQEKSVFCKKPLHQEVFEEPNLVSSYDFLAMKHLFQGEITFSGYQKILAEGMLIGATISHLGDTPTADILSQLASLRAEVEG